MYKLKSYLAEEKNVHMEHIEELIFNEGVEGTRKAINFLRDIRDTLAGNAARPTNFTVKWDGAPAIFAGIDPSDNKFFVAKKGIFNQNPQLFKTPRDIDSDPKFPNDLKEPFKIALAELKKMGIRGVVQGDFMFGPGDVKKEDINLVMKNLKSVAKQNGINLYIMKYVPDRNGPFIEFKMRMK